MEISLVSNMIHIQCNLSIKSSTKDIFWASRICKHKIILLVWKTFIRYNEKFGVPDIWGMVWFPNLLNAYFDLDLFKYILFDMRDL